MKGFTGITPALLLLVTVVSTPLSAAALTDIKASITSTSRRVRVGESVKFDGRKSDPGQGEKLTGMYWDFDDLDLVEVDELGDTVSHVFNHTGAYNVKLTVENELGERDVAVYSIEVLPEKGLSSPSITSRFENGKTGVFLDSPYTFAFRLEWGNQFFFRLDGCKGRPVSLRIYGYGKNRPIPASVTPYSDDDTFDAKWTALAADSYIDPDWQPLTEAKYTFDADSSAVTIRFTPKSESIYLAWAAPYVLHDLQAMIDHYEERPEFQWEPAGLSVEGRPIYHITLTDPQTPDSGKKVVWITGTQHGYEMAAGPVCEGVVAALLEDSDSSKALLKKTIFHLMPILNPDAVFHGGYRYNMHDVDLNRNWDTVRSSQWDRVVPEPEVGAAQNMIDDWVAHDGRMDLFMDFHCLTTIADNLLLIEAAGDSLPASVKEAQGKFYDLLARKYTFRRSEDKTVSSALGWVSSQFAAVLGTPSFTPEHCLGWIEPKGKGPVRATPVLFRQLGHDYVWAIRDFFNLSAK